jgi:DNA-binding response OmpR family regulator
MSDLLALVIEDDPDAAVIFSKAIGAIGFQTEVIRAGDKALERLKELTPDLVLLDLHLPNVAGTDILKQIRADERLVKTRVIIVTADPRMANACESQADLILVKPVSFSQVRDLVARFKPAQPEQSVQSAQ